MRHPVAKPVFANREPESMNTLRTPGSLAAIAAALSLACTTALAVCPAVEIASGLQTPGGVAITNQGNLIVSESGPHGQNVGRLSIVGPDGSRRTLISGMPSGIADVGDPAGPAGSVMRGRTLFVAISVGDVAISGGIPGQALANPNPVSSPLFSSVLAIHFSAAVEKNTQGFALTMADQNAIAAGQKVTLTNDAGEKLTIERVVDFVNYTPNPIPALPNGIRVSNPFDVAVIDDFLYVTDGGQNNLRKVDLTTGAQSVLATFPPVPNPMFGMIGGPFSEAVPTGIRAVDGMLLVTLFRGAPFAPGTSTVVALDPATGVWASFIGGLKTAIDVISTPTGSAHDYLVVQHASAGPFFGSPGQLLGFDEAGGSKTLLADCMTRPTSMALDAQTGVLYITELGGRLLAVPMAP
jgi:hypothetical protein